MSPHPQVREATTDRWSSLAGLLLAALYLWVTLWLVLAVIIPTLVLGWQPMVITSGSMSPLIRTGDVVLVSATDGPIDPGNVITFHDRTRHGVLVTHRIASVEPDGTYRTRGDANTTADSATVSPDDVVGRGRLLVTFVGLPVLWLSNALPLFVAWVLATGVAVVAVTARPRTRAPRTRTTTRAHPADAT